MDKEGWQTAVHGDTEELDTTCRLNRSGDGQDGGYTGNLSIKPVDSIKEDMKKDIVKVVTWIRASLVAQLLICLQSRRCGFDPWVGKIWRQA